MSAPDQTPATSVLELEREGMLATLWLNRPQHGNRLSAALLETLRAALAALEDDADVRVVVLAARGASFCEGLDEDEIDALGMARARRNAHLALNDFMLAFAALPKPTIARVHGRVAGVGIELVAACDLALATPAVEFVAAGSRDGRWPHSVQVALGRLLPRKHAMDMLLTGRPCPAAEAARYGLVNRVVDGAELDRAVATLAAEIAAVPAHTASLGKYSFDHQAGMRMADAYDFANDQLVFEPPGSGDAAAADGTPE